MATRCWRQAASEARASLALITTLLDGSRPPTSRRKAAHASAVAPAALLDPLRPLALNGQRVRAAHGTHRLAAVEVPAPETPKRASAAAELPQTEVRTKRTCAGRKAAAK